MSGVATVSQRIKIFAPLDRHKCIAYAEEENCRAARNGDHELVLVVIVFESAREVEGKEPHIGWE